MRVFLEGVGNLRKEAEAWAHARGAKVVSKILALFSGPTKVSGDQSAILNVLVLEPYSGTAARGAQNGPKDLTEYTDGDRSFRPTDWGKGLEAGPYQDMGHAVLTHSQFLRVREVSDYLAKEGWEVLSEDEERARTSGTPREVHRRAVASVATAGAGAAAAVVVEAPSEARGGSHR